MTGEDPEKKVLKLEIEAATAAQVKDIMVDFETKLDKRFDKIESLILARATEAQVKDNISKCLDEGHYVKRDDLYPAWKAYQERFEKEEQERVYQSWKNMHSKFTNENRSKTVGIIAMAKNLTWAGGMLLVISAAIEQVRRLFHGGTP